MKPIILLSLILIGLKSFASLTPSTSLEGAPSNDPYIRFQWPLFNSGQVVVEDLDDIHQTQTTLSPKAKIFWRNFDSALKKDPIVAILDSGLDKDHPELKGRVLPGLDFKARNPRLKNLFIDDKGHGSHMAGIMAAEINNSEGISGLSSRIQILPLKVYDDREGGATDPNVPAAGPTVGLIDRVILAMEHAITMKADVIHLSMGWPRSLNNEKVEAVFKKAFAQGAVIVAAAGNDHHEGQIFPCAYKDVICVGAIGLNAELAKFSNWGGHVDLLAPGQEILSIWPLHISSERFGPKGYDLKSGTSQAAPFVSGAAAILRGLYPEETPSQIRIRLLASAQEGYPKVSHGLLHIERAAQQSSLNLFQAPVFKGIEQVEVDPKSLQFELPILIEGRPSKASDFSVQSKNPKVQFQSLQFVQRIGQTDHYIAKGRVQNLDLENRLSYEVMIAKRSYQHQVLLSQNLTQATKQIFAIQGLPEKTKASDLFTLSNMGLSNQAQYWTWSKNEDSSINVNIVSLENGQAKTLSQVIPNALSPFGGFSPLAGYWLDTAEQSYFLMVLVPDEKGEVKDVDIVYLDHRFQIRHRFTLDYEGSVPSYRVPSDLVIGRIDHPELGSIKVPVYWDTALIPKADLSPNPLDFEQNFEARRIYYLNPVKNDKGIWTLQTRTLMSRAFEKYVRSVLKGDETQDVEVLGFAVQSQQNRKDGKLNLMFRLGRGINVELMTQTIKTLSHPLQIEDLSRLDSRPNDLSRNSIQEAWDLSEAKLELRSSFQGIYTNTVSRSLVLKNQQFLEIQTSFPLSEEQIIGSIQTFVRGSEVVNFTETTTALRVQGNWIGRTIDSKIPVFRSTFLPGSIFKQLFVPLTLGPEKRPALFFDNSPLFSRTSLVYFLDQDGQLKSPLRYTISIPADCLGRNPNIDEQGNSKMVYLCNTKSGVELRILD